MIRREARFPAVMMPMQDGHAPAGRPILPGGRPARYVYTGGHYGRCVLAMDRGSSPHFSGRVGMRIRCMFDVRLEKMPTDQDHQP